MLTFKRTVNNDKILSIRINHYSRLYPLDDIDVISFRGSSSDEADTVGNIHLPLLNIKK